MPRNCPAGVASRAARRTRSQPRTHATTTHAIPRPQIATAAAGSRLFPPAVTARVAGLGQREAGGEGVRIELYRFAQEGLALLRVAAEQARQPDEEGALGAQRVGVVRIELEGAVELGEQPPEREERGDGLAVQAHELTHVAEEREVRPGAAVVLRHGALGEALATIEMQLAQVASLRPAAGFALVHRLAREVVLHPTAEVGREDDGGLAIARREGGRRADAQAKESHGAP